MNAPMTASERPEAALPEPFLSPPAHPCPPGFTSHCFETRFRIGASAERVWAWLEDPRTFVDGQVWPFRVEFLSTEPGVAPGFSVGGLNIHHGPLLCLAGQLTEIEEGAYRSLHYLYGSHVLSLRFVRPTRLEFWVDAAENDSTEVRLRLESHVRGGCERIWTRLQSLFWGRFPRFMSRGIGATILG